MKSLLCRLLSIISVVIVSATAGQAFAISSDQAVKKVVEKNLKITIVNLSGAKQYFTSVGQTIDDSKLKSSGVIFTPVGGVEIPNGQSFDVIVSADHEYAPGKQYDGIINIGMNFSDYLSDGCGLAAHVYVPRQDGVYYGVFTDRRWPLYGSSSNYDQLACAAEYINDNELRLIIMPWK